MTWSGRSLTGNYRVCMHCIYIYTPLWYDYIPGQSLHGTAVPELVMIFLGNKALLNQFHIMTTYSLKLYYYYHYYSLLLPLLLLLLLLLLLPLLCLRSPPPTPPPPLLPLLQSINQTTIPCLKNLKNNKVFYGSK
jgi:hypothetical protein